MSSFAGKNRVINPGQHMGFAVRTVDAQTARTEAIAQAIKTVGPCIYALRFGDSVKIGWTANLSQRLCRLGVSRAEMDRLLVLMPGTRADEHALHLRFAAHLARGREYFHPHADVLGWVNDQRAALRLPPVT